MDLSSSGPLLIPGTSLLAGGGKTGILYVLNTANLGKETATDSGVVQEETITARHARRTRVLAAIHRERRPLAL
jgi:hypothetical protein